MAEKMQDKILDSSIAYLGKTSLRSQLVYSLCLILLISGFCILPFLHFDISVSAGGIIRPLEDRSELRSGVSATIRAVRVSDGLIVKEGDTLILLDDQKIQETIRFLKDEIRIRENHHADLLKLIARDRDPHFNFQRNREQSELFLAKQNELILRERKAQEEVLISRRLYEERVIAHKELQDLEHQLNLAKSNLATYKQEQTANWELELLSTSREIEKLKSDLKNANEEWKQYAVLAPVSGSVETLVDWYPGNQIMAGETILKISPDTSLVGECFIPTREMGLIKLGQPCIYQIDAFNYNRFGVIAGEILSVASDYVLINNEPAYRVRSSFLKTKLQLPNGFQGNLKKGMTYRVRFFVNRRSAWQLLYDKLDDWVNPA